MTRQQPAPGRYVTRETDDGTVELYDTENEDAWISTDAGVPLVWER